MLVYINSPLILLITQQSYSNPIVYDTMLTFPYFLGLYDGTSKLDF